MIVGIGIGIFIVNMLLKNPAFRVFFTEAQSIAQCQINLQEIGGGLDRYARRNGKSPAKLSELYPSFLETKTVLHCPDDRRSKDTVSYDYIPPAMNAPPSTKVVECTRHIVVKGQPPWVISLYKDGHVTKQPQKTSTQQR